LDLYLGRGDGSFQPAAALPTDAIPHLLRGADFDGDGRLDLAAAHENPIQAMGGVQTFLGNGDGTFPRSGRLDLQSPYLLETADFDGDGKIDLLVGTNNAMFTDPQLALYLGLGDGTFRPPTLTGGFTLMDAPSALAVGDFTGDGRPDLAASSQSGVVMLVNTPPKTCR
jgi:hypothetical protein